MATWVVLPKWPVLKMKAGIYYTTHPAARRSTPATRATPCPVAWLAPLAPLVAPLVARDLTRPAQLAVQAPGVTQTEPSSTHRETGQGASEMGSSTAAQPYNMTDVQYHEVTGHRAKLARGAHLGARLHDTTSPAIGHVAPLWGRGMRATSVDSGDNVLTSQQTDICQWVIQPLLDRTMGRRVVVVVVRQLPGGSGTWARTSTRTRVLLLHAHRRSRSRAQGEDVIAAS